MSAGLAVKEVRDGPLHSPRGGSVDECTGSAAASTLRFCCAWSSTDALVNMNAPCSTSLACSDDGSWQRQRTLVARG